MTASPMPKEIELHYFAMIHAKLLGFVGVAREKKGKWKEIRERERILAQETRVLHVDDDNDEPSKGARVRKSDGRKMERTEGSARVLRASRALIGNLVDCRLQTATEKATPRRDATRPVSRQL